MKEQTNMSLDIEVKEEAIKKIEKTGGKLSGLVQNLLIKFNNGEITL